MVKPNVRYKHLVDSQKRQRTVDLDAIKRDNTHKIEEEEEEEEHDVEKEAEELASKAFNFNKKDAHNFAVSEVHCSIGAIFAGCLFPMW
jgi:hypothetical protein